MTDEQPAYDPIGDHKEAAFYEENEDWIEDEIEEYLNHKKDDDEEKPKDES